MSGRDQYLRWVAMAPTAQRARAGAKMKTLDAALVSPEARQLHEMTGLPAIESAWLAGVTCALLRMSPGFMEHSGFRGRFVYTWATLAPQLHEKGQVHINESRFERWLSCCGDNDRADRWYEYTVEALKLTKGKAFDIASLYDIAALSCDESLPDYGVMSFKGRMALDFFNHQPLGRGYHAPKQTPIYALLGVQDNEHEQ